MTLWEFLAARDGYIHANKSEEDEKPEGMSAERARELGIEGF